jgi:hypothetical protein
MINTLTISRHIQQCLANGLQNEIRSENKILPQKLKDSLAWIAGTGKLCGLTM